MHDRRVQVVHVDFVLDREVTEVVGLAIGEAGFETAPGEQHGKARGVVVAARAVALGVGRAAKLAAPPHDRVVQQAAGLQILEQAGDRLVDAHGVVLVLRQIGVLVPRRIVRVVGVVDLDVAHTGFGEPARLETLPAVVVGRLLADPVKGERRRGFLRKIERVGGVVLQAPAELEGTGRRLELVVAGFRAELLFVQRAHELELPLLLGGGARRVADIAQTGLNRFLPGPADRRALVDRREKRAAVVPRSAVGERRTERDEGGEIFVLRTEPIRDPRAHRGADLVRRAGVEKERRGAVRHAVGVHRPDHAIVVGEFRHVRKQLGHPASALAALLEVPHRLHDAAGRARAGFGDRALIEEIEHLAVAGVKGRLVVEAVEVAHAAAHKQKDHALRPGGEVTGAGRERIRRAAGGRLRGEAGKRHIAETARELLQRLATGEKRGVIHGRGARAGGRISEGNGNRRWRKSPGAAAPSPRRAHRRRAPGETRPPAPAPWPWARGRARCDRRARCGRPRRARRRRACAGRRASPAR